MGLMTSIGKVFGGKSSGNSTGGGSKAPGVTGAAGMSGVSPAVSSRGVAMHALHEDDEPALIEAKPGVGDGGGMGPDASTLQRIDQQLMAQRAAREKAKQQFLLQLQRNYNEILSLVRKVDKHLDTQELRQQRLLELAEKSVQAVSVLPELRDASHRVATALDRLSEQQGVANENLRQMREQGAQAARSLDQIREQSARSAEALDRVSQDAARTVSTLNEVKQDTGRASATLEAVRGEAARSAEAIEVVRDQSTRAANVLDAVRDQTARSTSALDDVRGSSARSAELLSGLRGDQARAADLLGDLQSITRAAHERTDARLAASAEMLGQVRDVIRETGDHEQVIATSLHDFRNSMGGMAEATSRLGEALATMRRGELDREQQIAQIIVKSQRGTMIMIAVLVVIGLVAVAAIVLSARG